MAKDFLLDKDGNFIIENGDFKVGDSDLQEVLEIVDSHPGEFKEDPIIGASLTTMLKSRYDQDRIDAQLRKHLARDGKNYDDYKELLSITR